MNIGQYYFDIRYAAPDPQKLMNADPVSDPEPGQKNHQIDFEPSSKKSRSTNPNECGSDRIRIHITDFLLVLFTM